MKMTRIVSKLQLRGTRSDMDQRQGNSERLRELTSEGSGIQIKTSGDRMEVNCSLFSGREGGYL